MSQNSLKVRNALTLKPANQPSNPENGDMYYDTTANLFYFYQNGSWFTPNNAVSYANSATKTPSALNTYMSMTSNSLALGVGTYQLLVQTKFTNDGTSPAYSFVQCGLYGANGADTGSAPSAMSNVTVLGGNAFWAQDTPANATQNNLMFTTFIQVTSATTVYAVPLATFTAAHARVNVYLQALQVA